MKINKKSINKLRSKDLLLTILALVFLFVGIPAYVSLLNNWNTNIANPGDYQRMEEEDFINLTMEYEEISEEHSIFTVTSDVTFQEQTSIVWSENSTSNHTMVIEGENNYDSLLWITPWKISDLITNATNSFHIKIKMPMVLNDYESFRIYYMTETDNTIGISASGSMDKKYFDNTDQLDYFVNRSTIDLMVDKAEFGNDRIIFLIILDSDVYLEAGDIVEFDFYYYQPDSTQIDENQALQWGGAVAGVVCILIAVGSTSLWNPFDKKRPGWIDLQIKKLLNRRSKK